MVDLAIPTDLNFKPFRDGIDTFGPDPVETARNLIGSFAEFSSCVEVGHNELKSGHFMFHVHVHRDTPAVVLDGDRTLSMEAHFYGVAVAGESLVNRVIHDLKYAVVESSLIGISDIHIGALANPFQTFQFFDFGGIVYLREVFFIRH